MTYSKEVIERFQHPKYVGNMKDADVVGKVGNPVCGDVMEIMLKVKDKVILDAKVKTFGCVAAISTSDVVCELSIGKTLDEAIKISKEDVVRELESLPGQKIHCSLLAIDALHKAIKKYKENFCR